MLLRLFKNSNFSAYFYLLGFALLEGCLLIFLKNKEIENASGLLAYFSFNQHALAYKITAVFLFLLNVLLFDLMTGMQEVVEKENHLSSYIYCIFSGLLLQLNPLHPMLAANLFVLFALFRVLSSYRVDKAQSAVFDGAFFISAAGLIYPPYVLFIILPFCFLLVLRPFKLREWVLSGIAVLTPYFLCSTVLYLLNYDMAKPFKDIAISFHKASFPDLTGDSMLIDIAGAILLVVTALYFMVKSPVTKIKMQRSWVVSGWLLAASLPLVFMSHKEGNFIGLCLLIPFSVFTGLFFGGSKSRILAEILLLFVTASVVLNFLNIQI